MTGIDASPRRALRGAVAAAVLLATQAGRAGDDATLPWYGLADLPQPGRTVQLYAPAAGSAPAALSFVQLAPLAGAPAVVRCCLRPQGRAHPADAARAALLGTDANPPPLLQQRGARAPAAWRGPALALAFAGRDAQVQTLSPQALRIRWPGRALQLEVRQCLSREGVHVRVTPQGGAPLPARHYYLALGMDVDPDCPPDMLAPTAPR
jgi:hypothetical protein